MLCLCGIFEAWIQYRKWVLHCKNYWRFGVIINNAVSLPNEIQWAQIIAGGRGGFVEPSIKKVKTAWAVWLNNAQSHQNQT